MTDIGDVDAEPRPPVRQAFERDGVVKISRRLAVYRDRQPIAQIHAPGQVFITDGFRYGFGFPERGLRKDMRQAVLADDDLDIYAGRVGLAQHFDDAAPRRATGDG